jgi:glucose-1-phosphate cytidylyltransferase
MKTVILCGGLGTRLAEETEARPKPMVTLGGRPILWHIMSFYGAQGFKDFSLALGYKGDLIKKYFLHYYALTHDFTVDLKSGKMSYEGDRSTRDWRVSLVDTGERTETGGRLKRLAKSLKGTFMLTYGDGVADVDLKKLLAFHKSHKKLVTVTAVRPTARFGGVRLDGSKVAEFKEKPQSGEGWINGGYFVIEPEFLEWIDGDKTVLELGPLETAAKKGQLMAYRHEGFWQCMDTLRERRLLEDLWAKDRAPWKLWRD